MSTDKLKQKAMKCNAAHLGVISPLKTPRKTTAAKFDQHYHRMLVALKCAVSNRPFASSEDEFYRMEVEHLRQGMCSCLLHASLKLTWDLMEALLLHLGRLSVKILKLSMLMRGTS
jgi:hypothetical protein